MATITIIMLLPSQRLRRHGINVVNDYAKTTRFPRSSRQRWHTIFKMFSNLLICFSVSLNIFKSSKITIRVSTFLRISSQKRKFLQNRFSLFIWVPGRVLKKIKGWKFRNTIPLKRLTFINEITSRSAEKVSLFLKGQSHEIKVCFFWTQWIGKSF